MGQRKVRSNTGLTASSVENILCDYAHNLPPRVITFVTSWPESILIRVLGFVVRHRAMKEAMARAKLTGIGAVTIRNTTHFGTCSAYSLLAVKENMIGFACTTGRMAAAPGATGPVIGMNAMSFAVPSGKEFPFRLDMATTIAAHGKVEVALRTGQSFPKGWTIDPEGNPITNPKENATKKGAMVLLGTTPELGIYKGFGLNIMVDILRSILTGSVCIPEIRSRPGTSKCTHFFCAINISGFLPPAEFQQGMDRMIAIYHNLPEAKGVTNITVPGELEWALEQERRKNGIPLDDEVIQSLKDLSKEFKVDYNLN